MSNCMARKNVPLVADRPYHISSICSNKEWFKIPIEEVWEIMSNNLKFIHQAYDIRILSFVLMNNHFHLLAMFPQNNMGANMNYFLRETSKEINARANRQHHAFKRTYFRSLINTYHYYTHAYKYVYRNPVEAGICNYVEEYRYSTLHSTLGQSRSIIPTLEDDTLFSDLSRTVNWLNRPVKTEHREAVRRALRRSEFCFPELKGRATHPLEIRLY